jgi:hypothetical protein
MYVPSGPPSRYDQVLRLTGPDEFGYTLQVSEEVSLLVPLRCASFSIESAAASYKRPDRTWSDMCRTIPDTPAPTWAPARIVKVVARTMDKKRSRRTSSEPPDNEIPDNAQLPIMSGVGQDVRQRAGTPGGSGTHKIKTLQVK